MKNLVLALLMLSFSGCSLLKGKEKNIAVEDVKTQTQTITNQNELDKGLVTTQEHWVITAPRSTREAPLTFPEFTSYLSNLEQSTAGLSNATNGIKIELKRTIQEKKDKHSSSSKSINESEKKKLKEKEIKTEPLNPWVITVLGLACVVMVYLYVKK